MTKINKWIFWTPRVFAIAFILFLALFSLDIFGNDYTFWETVLGLFMHNIPSLVLLVILLVAWRYEIVGAIAFVLAGFAYILFVVLSKGFEWFMIAWIIQIAGPAFLIAFLFWLGWKQRNRKK